MYLFLLITVDSHSAQKCIFYSFRKHKNRIALGTFQRLLVCSIKLMQPWQGLTFLSHWEIDLFSETNLHVRGWPDSSDTGNPCPTFQYPLISCWHFSPGGFTANDLSSCPHLAPGLPHRVTSCPLRAKERKEITIAENDLGTWLQVVT